MAIFFFFESEADSFQLTNIWITINSQMRDKETRMDSSYLDRTLGAITPQLAAHCHKMPNSIPIVVVVLPPPAFSPSLS